MLWTVRIEPRVRRWRSWEAGTGRRSPRVRRGKQKNKRWTGRNVRSVLELMQMLALEFAWIKAREECTEGI